MAVGTYSPDAVMLQILWAREYAIAEIGFGGQAQAGHRTGCGDLHRFLRRQMSGVDQAPARIHGEMVVQPLHRALAGPGQAVIHLFLLFSNMNMNRLLARMAGQNGANLLRRNGP